MGTERGPKGPLSCVSSCMHLRSDMTVELMDSMGSDDSIIRAMMVSTKGGAAKDTTADFGRINFLMKNRHGCYDSETEVLTRDGWKRWPDVKGTEEFLTLNRFTDEMEYQHAERLVRKPVDGPMIQIKMAQVDALVTPDHRMFAARRQHRSWDFDLVPAKEFLERCHRVRLGGGIWDGEIHAPEEAALVGFIAAHSP